METSKKLRLVTFLLAFFFGTLGVHRFYVGKIGTAVTQLILSLSVVGLFVSGIWVVIDWIMILAGSFKDKEGRIIITWVN